MSAAFSCWSSFLLTLTVLFFGPRDIRELYIQKKDIGKILGLTLLKVIGKIVERIIVRWAIDIADEFYSEPEDCLGPYNNKVLEFHLGNPQAGYIITKSSASSCRKSYFNNSLTCDLWVSTKKMGFWKKRWRAYWNVGTNGLSSIFLFVKISVWFSETNLETFHIHSVPWNVHLTKPLLNLLTSYKIQKKSICIKSLWKISWKFSLKLLTYHTGYPSL